MCGIVGAASTRNVVDLLIEGIRKLEYRGYDSTGIAYVKSGRLERLRSTGRVAHLDGAVPSARSDGHVPLAADHHALDDGLATDAEGRNDSGLELHVRPKPWRCEPR